MQKQALFNRLLNLINLFFYQEKNSYHHDFERSIYDVVIDPSRYRLSHKPILIKLIYNIFFKNTKKIYINTSYEIIKKRKNELTRKKYILLRKNITLRK